MKTINVGQSRRGLSYTTWIKGVLVARGVCLLGLHKLCWHALTDRNRRPALQNQCTHCFGVLMEPLEGTVKRPPIVHIALVIFGTRAINLAMTSFVTKPEEKP